MRMHGLRFSASSCRMPCRAFCCSCLRNSLHLQIKTGMALMLLGWSERSATMQLVSAVSIGRCGGQLLGKFVARLTVHLGYVQVSLYICKAGAGDSIAVSAMVDCCALCGSVVSGGRSLAHIA